MHQNQTKTNVLAQRNAVIKTKKNVKKIVKKLVAKKKVKRKNAILKKSVKKERKKRVALKKRKNKILISYFKETVSFETVFFIYHYGFKPIAMNIYFNYN